jgi:Tfp pilus assembly protein PilO
MTLQDKITDFFRSFNRAWLSNYSKELLTVLVILSMSLFYYEVFYSQNVELIHNLEEESSRFKKEIAVLIQEKQLSKKQEESFKRMEDKYKELQQRFILTRSKLPSEKQLSLILKEITNEEAGKDISFMNVRPFPLEDEEEYLRFPFRVDLEAPFFNIIGYVKRLENLERIINISNFRIDSEEKTLPVIKVQLHASTFVLNAN